MKLFEGLTLKQNLFIFLLFALIPWLLGLILSVYYIYPNIKDARLKISAEKDIPF